jgi:hypothetical protein
MRLARGSEVGTPEIRGFPWFAGEE